MKKCAITYPAFFLPEQKTAMPTMAVGATKSGLEMVRRSGRN
jgi:hypothetical protein